MAEYCGAHGAAGIYNEEGAERCTPAIPAGDLADIKAEFEVNKEAILLETALAPDGSKLIHLINCANSADAENVTVKLPFTASKVEIFSYETGLSAVMSAPDIVTIPAFRTLCTLKFQE